MATRADIYKAIKNADAAGDSASVQKLGAYLATMPKDAPADGMGRAESFAAGVQKPFESLAGGINAGLKAIGVPIDAMARAVSGHTQSEVAAANDTRRAQSPYPGYVTMGNIAGTLPTMALRGGQAAQGGVTGALLSDKPTFTGKLGDAAVGAVTGVVGGKVLRGVANIASPVVSKGAAALKAAGVPMTLGQLARQAGESGSGFAKSLGRFMDSSEEAASSIPVVGTLIKTARERGVLEYNQSNLNRALGYIGEKLPDGIEPGRQSIAATGDLLSKGYQRVVPLLNATPDKEFQAGVAALRGEVQTLPDSTQRQFAAILKGVFKNREKSGALTGQDLKDADSVLANKVRKYMGHNADPDQHSLGEALDEIRSQLRKLVTRQNPEHAGELKALNKGWAELKTAQKASLADNGGTGIYTPKQYAAAAKAADSGKTLTANGRFFNQGTTDAAADILSNKLPNSGTADRALAALAGHAVATGTLAGATAPGALAAGTASLLYTKAGQKALNRLFLADRPAAVKAAAIPLRALSRYAPVIAPALIARGDN